ncbi:hypothetical protein F2P79_009189 [Pimephales promelas]|nr:hypothetical protein F2P79_009189 [Pimephales promelas]
MPFGLSISPAVFQGFMNEIFRDYLNQFVIIYIDDILIYSANLSEHRLREHHLYLKLEKCKFHQSTIQFLGYVITPHGITMDQRKVDAVTNWPQPTNIKELQRFLGFANFYRRFIKGFSQISAPITSLLKNRAKSLSWTTDTINAFEELKRTFSSAPTLILPDPDLPFLVEVDASTSGVGAVLSQRQGNSPRLHPCAFFSKKLATGNCWPSNSPWKNGDTDWREHNIPSFSSPIIVTWNISVKLADSTLAKPAGHSSSLTSISPLLTVQDIRISRLMLYHASSNRIPWSVPFSGAWNDHIAEATQTEPAPPGDPEGRVYVPSRLRLSLMDSVHTSLGSGHPGSHQTLSLIQQRYWWPDMTQDVSRYVKSCSVCAMAKVPRRLPEGKLVPLPVPTHPWSHLGVDFITDLPASDSHTCILVVVDRFSKACKLIPLPGLPTAFETAETLFHQVFRHFGIPEDIVSDRGPQFISRVWKAFFNLLGVTVSLTIRSPIARLSGRSRRSGDTCGHIAMTTRTAGVAICHGPSMCRIRSAKPPPASPLFSAYSVSSLHYSPGPRAVRRHKSQADARHSSTPQYQPGQLVWLSTWDIRLRQPCRKLSPRYLSPFAIQRQINEVTYQLSLPAHYRISPSFHVSLLKPYSNPLTPSSPGSGAEDVPPPSRMLLQNYFGHFKMCFTSGDFTTNWQRLEVGIVTGCTISVILFAAAMNLLVKSVEKPRRGAVLSSGVQQVPIRAFMDDLTITARSVPEGRWILEDLVELATAAKMEFKPSKSRSLVLKRGRVQDRFRFKIGEDTIPTVSEKPIKSLGRWYRADLTDKASWNELKAKDRKEMVQKEIRAVEEESRQARVVAMKQQGSWTRWGSVRGRALSWKDIWNMEGHRIMLLLSSVYDVLPTPTNLQRWRLTEDPSCALCKRPVNLEHILSSCRAGLTEGRFRWRHDQVLAQLAEGLEKERKRKRSKAQDRGPRFICFLRPGEKAGKEDRCLGIIGTAEDWEMRVDLGRKLKFPEEIAATRQVALIELTVPWEERIEEAHERKLGKYQSLITESQQRCWRAWNLPVERGNPQEPSEQDSKAGRDSIQIAVVEEERAVAKPGWQRGRGSEQSGIVLNDRGSSSRTLALLSSLMEVSWAT